MADIPRFLNRVDFFGVLLPGYIAVILSIIHFTPDLLTKVETQGTQGTQGEQRQISADLFTAVVFLVAGPAVDYVVKSFQRYAYSVTGLLTQSGRQKRKRNNDVYAQVRVKSSKEEREELDMVESSYDFNISTSVILILIGFYYSYSKGPDATVLLPLYILAAILLFGGSRERVETFGPLIYKLMQKYNIQ